MKVGILFICTGKYNRFWPDFYTSSQQYLLPGISKKYFVFTDADIDTFNDPDVLTIAQPQLPFPYPTLYRYRFFLAAEEKMKDVDYLIFFNSNIIFKATITPEEFLPGPQEKLVAIIHPGYYNVPPDKFPLENRKRSLAYLPYEKAQHYYMGVINGGLREDFLQACRTIDERIRVDEKNKVMAIWHDESHWNRYLLDFPNKKVLHPGFVYPEGMVLPYEMKSLLLDKSKLGGHNNLRKLTAKDKVIHFMKKIRRAIKKRLKV